MSDHTDQITDAVLAVPGVLALGGDPDPDGSSMQPNGASDGITTDAWSTSVHVWVAAAVSVRTTAHRVQQAAHDITGGRVDVTVEDVR